MRRGPDWCGAETSGSQASYHPLTPQPPTPSSTDITIINATLPELRERVAELTAEPAEEALIRYISVNAQQENEEATRVLTTG